jgi:hypothetical protein
MKKIFIVLILASGISICAIAQKKAPKEVVKTFTEKFANASSIKWNRESADEWEAEFKLNGKEMSAAFDNAGI